MEKKDVLRRAAKVFDIPTDIAGGEIHIELAGRGEVLCENHKGILLLSEEEVEISLGRETFSVVGEGLTVLAMNANEVRIRGRINGISFNG